MKIERAQEPLCFTKKETPTSEPDEKDPKPYSTQTSTKVAQENTDRD
jgi:hypothetical protein